MVRDWKRLSTKTIFTHPRLTVVEDEVVLPDDAKTTYLRYEGLPDYVTVIAIRDKQIALIKEYSYPHNEWLWQFPEGSVEDNEDPAYAAERELSEEAGLAGKLEKLGMNYSHHRRSTEKNYVFIAQDVGEATRKVGDIEEQGITVHWFSEADIKNMIVSGKIVQKNALSALALYFSRPSGS